MLITISFPAHPMDLSSSADVISQLLLLSVRLFQSRVEILNSPKANFFIVLEEEEKVKTRTPHTRVVSFQMENDWSETGLTKKQKPI